MSVYLYVQVVELEFSNCTSCDKMHTNSTGLCGICQQKEMNQQFVAYAAKKIADAAAAAATPPPATAVNLFKVPYCTHSH